MATAPDNPPETPPETPAQPEMITCTATGEERPMGTPLGGPVPKTNAQLLAEQEEANAKAEEERKAAVVVVVGTTGGDSPLS